MTKQGLWLPIGVKYNKELDCNYLGQFCDVRCSECGYTTHNKLHVLFGCPYKVCPNCNAEMRNDKHD